MRVGPVLAATLVLALARERAVAQQTDTVRRPVVRSIAATSKAADRRVAEHRRRRVDFIDAKTVSASTRVLADRKATGTTLLTSGDEQTTYLLLRRTESSKPEVHARWDDIIIVRSGVGAIAMGDSLVGSTYRGPGERVGGTFTKSYEIVVHAGDMVRIPAAVPHAFIVTGAEPLVYVMIKQRRQELPIRWYTAR